MATFAIVGLGEVGTIFARDLARAGITTISGYDIDAAARGRAVGIAVAADAATAARAAEVVIVAVTAAAVPQAMRSLADGLAHAPLVVDVNSVSPEAKRDAARVITEVGGRYVEAAVMASVPPRGIGTPMLLGGPHAEAFQRAMDGLGMDLTVFSPEIGRASSVKMCRSVMIKGLEALTTECMLAARHYGVEDEVLGSLGDTLPHEDWRKLARYVISRALVHGRRRAEEMREVARTVADAGVEPLLSRAIAERQDWAGAQGRQMPREALAATDLDALLDGLTAAMQPRAAAD